MVGALTVDVDLVEVDDTVLEDPPSTQYSLPGLKPEQSFLTDGFYAYQYGYSELIAKF
jgi:hypothetical protein